ncbi:spore coat protein [Heyndrickxia ginsengihumi]|uniref:Spore coat protein n=1 Tax=Heyndrickxia ginsengihumi TaxID=363870 RepID=A0A0A6VH76_9BACI|nr:spore coat protein [Heyndrickxia ginsengihumi]KHD86931.1 spore gernimation protein GerQ [Heyndrickxia ginsengihumi]MBE6182739.1 spore coat protein [Bacillus sp. (in: firmicutes)]MCM3021948.1 spore coat protein [Heyndrickxia ginsengihumi]NEY20863.1 spore coat protein [Heyndrickxia ginsengihumi]
MNEFIQKMVGMGGMTDQVIATDLLTSVKSGVKMLSFAVTEAATDEVRAALTEQLHHAIDLHEQVTDYMISKGYYHPYNLQEQIHVDVNTAQTALNIPLPSSD